MKRFRTMKKVWLTLLVLFAFIAQLEAQKVHRTAAHFGGECSGTKYKFSNSLKSLIRTKRKGGNYEDCTSKSSEFCENSFAFDLNGDGRQEYFVRLGCGATGNCTYGIFADRPAKLVAKINAWFFWIDKPGGSWRKITAYEREGGDQGYIQTYTFRRGKYRVTAGRTERFDSTQKPFYVKMGIPDCTSR